LPDEGGLEIGALRIALGIPEVIVGFAAAEEFFADALAAELWQQDGFAEVADAVDVPTSLEEGLLELGTFFAEGDAGGGADDFVIVVVIGDEDDAAVGGFRISAEVFALVFQGALIEVGIFAEDGDAEFAEALNPWSEGLAAEFVVGEH
jgi:hypothetical protein